jgi:upstream activation factor subunit UAF30
MARPTRGGAAKKKAPVKKRTPKKKSADKVKADDDSDLELNSDGEVKPKKERKGGFHKQYHLSAPLADLVGESTVRLASYLIFLCYWYKFEPSD